MTTTDNSILNLKNPFGAGLSLVAVSSSELVRAAQAALTTPADKAVSKEKTKAVDKAAATALMTGPVKTMMELQAELSEISAEVTDQEVLTAIKGFEKQISDMAGQMLDFAKRVVAGDEHPAAAVNVPAATAPVVNTPAPVVASTAKSLITADVSMGNLSTAATWGQGAPKRL